MNNMNKILCAVLLAGIIACTSKNSSTGYKIFGTISNLPNTPIIIKQLKNGNWENTDTALSQSGTFTFYGKLNYPEMIRIYISDTLPFIPLFADNNEITISGSIDSLKNIKISGSKTHDEYESFWGSLLPYSLQLDSIGTIYNLAETANDSILLKQASKAYDSVSLIETIKMENYVIQKKSSIVSAYITYSQLVHTLDLQKLDSITALFDTSLNHSIYIQLLKNHIETLKRVEPGQPAPDFTMNNTEDQPVILSSLYGNYLLIDFWASWCPPCRKENPNIVNAYNRFHKKGFDILSVSFDKKKTDWLKAINDDKLTWNHVSDLNYWGNAAGKLYGIRSIPSNILLDPKGIILAKNLHGNKLTLKLEELLNTK
jgi:peroxiredoxin